MAVRSSSKTPGRTGFLRSRMRRLFVAALAAAAAAGVAANVAPDEVNLGDDLISFTGILPEIVDTVPAPRGARLGSNTDGSPAPFRFLFLNNITRQTPDVENFIINTLMPAAGRAIARSVRVRLYPIIHDAHACHLAVPISSLLKSKNISSRV